MIKAQFGMALPGDPWITTLSESFPDATFRLLTGLPVEDGAVELGEVVADDAAAAAAAVRDHPDVVDYEQLFVGERRALAQYRSTDEGLYEFLAESSFPPEFPIVVEDGRVEFELTTTREQLEEVRAALDASPLEYELLSVVATADPDALLTDRQRELLDAAVRRGYFEVPRECTLADLAAAVGVDKSTASGVLRRGEGRIVKSFLTGAAGFD